MVKPRISDRRTYYSPLNTFDVMHIHGSTITPGSISNSWTKTWALENTPGSDRPFSFWANAFSANCQIWILAPSRSLIRLPMFQWMLHKENRLRMTAWLHACMHAWGWPKSLCWPSGRIYAIFTLDTSSKRRLFPFYIVGCIQRDMGKGWMVI